MKVPTVIETVPESQTVVPPQVRAHGVQLQCVCDFSVPLMSLQRSANISDARSAVAAQVSTNAKWSGEGKDFRIASVWVGVIMIVR